MEIRFNHMQILVHLHANKTFPYSLKGFALGLALIQRRKPNHLLKNTANLILDFCCLFNHFIEVYMQLMILSHVSCLCLVSHVTVFVSVSVSMSLSHVSASVSVSCHCLSHVSCLCLCLCLMSLSVMSHASVSVSCFCLCLTHAPEFQTFKQFAHMQLVYW